MNHQLTVDELRELIVDNFAGGGGASTGIALAIGRSVDIAINHDPAAIAMHRANHPDTQHFCESVWDVDPRQATQGHAVGLAWFSPDCKHFSKAKGGKPVEKKIRGLAWVAVRWAATVRPRVIMLENVEEFTTWGPLVRAPDGQMRPDPKRKGREFQAFVNALRRQGYQVEWRELRACDYGAPTIRRRLFLIARRDGRPIVWPQPTHGDPKSEAVRSGRLRPWRTAAEIIDWSLPCPSIFERERPLAENTLRRIARGIKRFVMDNPQPFIIKFQQNSIGQSLDRPLDTVMAGATRFGLVSPALIQMGYGEREGQAPRALDLDRPIGTITAGGNKFAIATAYLDRQFGRSVGHAADVPIGTITAGGGGKANRVAAFLAKHYGGNYTGAGVSPEDPLSTVTTADHNALVTSHLIKLRGTCADGQPITVPMPTVTAGGLHVGEVRAFLLKYYGTSIGQEVDQPLQTVTTKARFGLVTIAGEDYQIVDIGMRMLEPHELFAAQGFPCDYIIDRDHDGKRYSKAAQIARCGNAVPPQFAEALVRANLPELCSPGGDHGEHAAAFAD